MRTYTANTFSLRTANINDIQVLIVPIQLPDADAFVTAAYNLAFPQVVAFCTAVIGITVVTLMLKSFHS